MLVPNIWVRRGAAPFDTLNTVRQHVDRLFDEYSTGMDETWTMPTEVIEADDELRFAIEMPGLRPDDIELTIESNVLTVTGEKKLERRGVETEDNFRLAERRYGRYTRSFRLPTTVDTNRVHASCEHGVLTIRLPRTEEAKPRRIQISDSDGAQQVTRGQNPENGNR